jgi:hypothetical protein
MNLCESGILRSFFYSAFLQTLFLGDNNLLRNRSLRNWNRIRKYLLRCNSTVLRIRIRWIRILWIQWNGYTFFSSWKTFDRLFFLTEMCLSGTGPFVWWGGKKQAPKYLFAPTQCKNLSWLLQCYFNQMLVSSHWSCIAILTNLRYLKYAPRNEYPTICCWNLRHYI